MSSLIKNALLISIVFLGLALLSASPVRAEGPCPGAQIYCAGRGCTAPVSTIGALCPSPSGGQYADRCGTCACPSGQINCSGACQSPRTGNCPEGTTIDPCTGVCPSVSYIMRSPNTSQPAFFNITGDMKSDGGDLYLNSGKAIRVDSMGATALNIGNYLGNVGNFSLRLHAPDMAMSELLFQQGGKTAPAYALDVAGDVRWTGILQGGFVPWARLTGFPTACPAGQYVSGVGGTLTCNTLAGGSLSGSGTVNTLPRFTGLTALGDSIITQTSGTINVDGSITATGCFGAVYAGSTSASYNGSQGGYRGVNTLCNTAITGTHVCSTDEIMNSIRCNSIIPQDGSFWIVEGPPGYTALANDCVGWTNNTSGLGTYWDFDQGVGGVGWMTVCSSTLQFACCK
ncbi:MAG: hypothetical protein UX98_C0010G0020 [Parcubacteria group bacterium GW2011_GWA2_47_26]|nr:MAG: hypothetical protein UX98_C0010G0020 [Parcubacteria group bacterium GW2011_GWA2_47_26]